MSRERIVCKAVIEDGGRILVLLDDLFVDGRIIPCWDLPGGKPEDGETPEQTVRREVREETGLEITSTDELARFPMRTRKGEKTCVVFRCVTSSTQVDLSRNPSTKERINDFRWVPRAELSDLEMRPEMKRFLLEAFS